MIFDPRATTILVRMERQIKDVEARLSSFRPRDHNPVEPGANVKIVS